MLKMKSNGKSHVLQEAGDVVGRNLFLNSGNFDSNYSKNWMTNGGGISLDNTTLYNGHPTIKTTLPEGIAGYPGPNGVAPLYWYKVEVGEIYTYSALIKSSVSDAGTFNTPLHSHIANDTDAGSSGSVTPIKYNQALTAGEWSLLYVTFKATKNRFRPIIYSSGTTGEINIAWLKLEKGSVPTDWTPAPEDIQSELDSIKARLAALEAA